MTIESITIVQVAVPGPFREPLDYLPARNAELIDYQPGLRVLVPLGQRRVVGIVTGIKHKTDLQLQQLKPITKAIDDTPCLDQALLSLASWASQYYHHPIGEVYHQLLPTLLRKPEHQSAEMTDIWRATQKGQLIDPCELKRSQKQQQALQLLREHPQGLTQPVLTGLGAAGQTLRALARKGLAELHEHPRSYKHWSVENILAEPPLPLNPEQSEALNVITGTDVFATYLLHGVTGSGKTEVYLQVIEHSLRQGKQALILVPEINLTPQTLSRFKHRFKVPIVHLHSNLTDHQRLQAWRQAKAGAAAIIIGTRSALFSPMKNPGIIIVDEEHDSSYKQQDGFRYCARDMAIVRAKLENIPVVLGSATPSLESLNNCEKGSYTLCKLTERAGNATPPAFELVDLKHQELNNGLTEHALKSIATTLAEGNQVLVFLNRRGYAPVLMCHDCGWQAKCQKCDARMTYHQSAKRLHCHHCDFQTPIPRHCQTCSSSDLRTIGQGTERLEENLAQRFKKYPVIRIDKDTTTRKDALTNHLKPVHSGVPCLLIGTQMLAKGHHFPDVTLVVIADIDAGLFASDFRATEHTAQLIEQVAGRAGRANKRGRVIIQSLHPDHIVLQTLSQGSYGDLSQTLMTERRLIQFPPFAHLALVRAESPQAERCKTFLETIVQQANALCCQQGVDLWGPVPTLMQRKAGKHRFQIVLRCAERKPLHKAINLIIELIEQHDDSRRIKWHLDIDPTYIE